MASWAGERVAAGGAGGGNGRRYPPAAAAGAPSLVGCHHRIPHEALVEWLGRNQQYEQEIA